MKYLKQQIVEIVHLAATWTTSFMRFTFCLFLTILSLVCKAQRSELDTSITFSDTIVKGEVIIDADARIPALIERYKKENEGAKIPGYRVQLFSGDRKSAFDMRANFMQTLTSYSATVIYDSPNFKTQVGNFRTKLEAEKALEQIWPLFKGAFVVKTEIDLPALPIEKDQE